MARLIIFSVLSYGNETLCLKKDSQINELMA